MDLVGFVSYLRQFKADVLLFGLAAWGVSLLLQKTLLKKAGAKVQAFLPFALGTVLYAAYRLILFGGLRRGGGERACRGADLRRVRHGAARPARRTDKGVSVKAACVQSVLAGYITLSAEEAETLAEAIETDEAGAKERLAAYVGEAADTFYLAPFRNAENVRRGELNTAKQETFC